MFYLFSFSPGNYAENSGYTPVACIANVIIKTANGSKYWHGYYLPIFKIILRPLVLAMSL